MKFPKEEINSVGMTLIPAPGPKEPAGNVTPYQASVGIP